MRRMERFIDYLPTVRKHGRQTVGKKVLPKLAKFPGVYAPFLYHWR
jgi:hypothetical protein